jgi:excisionase family DNA binding protein
MARRLASVDDAAAYLGVSPKTVRRSIARGQLTGYRLGRLVRVDLDEIDADLQPIPTVHRPKTDAAGR